jgi:two-component system, OmpR family, response regulator
MSNILVIEDEPLLRALIVRLLSTAGYRVTGVATGTEGLHAALSEDHDLVILDLLLPDLPGEEVLHVLLAGRPEARVLILSSVSEVGRRVGVLNGGAADFVAKPFVNAELLARVRLRARERPNHSGRVTYLPIHADARLDLHRRELVINDQRIPLSQREFTLLTHLLERKGEVCSRQELLADVWGIGFDPGTNVVDVYVGRLRAKLMGDIIETVRNVGYRLCAS